ncbi:MAG: ArsA family ATPase [Candidatus Korobacteraceae bacterium]
MKGATVEAYVTPTSGTGTPGFLGPRDLQLLIFGGKGGVGKTTCAAAAALRLAARAPQLSFLLVSTDPAHSLADSLADLAPPRNLRVLELNPQEYLADFKNRHGDKLREIASRGTFLDDAEINRFLDLSLPGLDELMAFLEISAWVEKRAYDCIIVDTAPSGHTLRLLAMPQFLRKWVTMLETLLAKHRYMKWVFARSRDRDHLDTFLDELTSSVGRMEAILEDSRHCSFVPVMLAEKMSVRETVAIVKEADRLKLPINDIIINKLYPDSPCPVCREEYYLQSCELTDLFRNTFLTRFAIWGIPLHAEEVRGQIALQSFWEAARQIREPPPAVPQPKRSPKIEVTAGIPSPPPGTSLLIFAGKGGVGKTTLACATALHLAKRSSDSRVLLVSTGPSHSLSSCLDMPIDSQPQYVLPGVTAIEIDSEAEFAALKHQYAGDIETFLETLSSNFDLAFDGEVLERMLDLSPPGLDEVMGLTRVMAFLASGEFDLLVLDSAATGHLIRLLELPEIIDQWLKAFFDLFLKYQPIFRLTGFSQELVSLSKNLKKLRQLLNDPAQCALYAVSIPTDMAFEETRDLLAACGRLGINVPGIFLNLVTPASDCRLCSAMNRRESPIYKKLRQNFHGSISVIYRRGEVRGLHGLEQMGDALYQCEHVDAEAAYAY